VTGRDGLTDLASRHSAQIQQAFSKVEADFTSANRLQTSKIQAQGEGLAVGTPLLPGILAILAKVGGWFEAPNKKNMRKSDFPKVWT